MSACLQQIEWAWKHEISVVCLFGCWLDEAYLEKGIDVLVKLSKDLSDARFLFIEAPQNAGKALPLNIGYLRSKVCSQPNAKFLEIQSSVDGSAVEKKINTLLNGPPLRLDEVPRTLILNGGKVASSVLGFRSEDLQRISQILAGGGQFSRRSDNSALQAERKDFLSQPVRPQEAPGNLNVPDGTLFCQESVTKMLKKTSTKMAELIQQVQSTSGPSAAPIGEAERLQDLKKNSQELASRLHSAIFDGRPESSSSDGPSKPRRLYEAGRQITERCSQAEQKLDRAKNVADFKASQLRFIGESMKVMEIMTSTDTLNHWLAEDCHFMNCAPQPSSISSPLAHLLHQECTLESMDLNSIRETYGGIRTVSPGQQSTSLQLTPSSFQTGPHFGAGSPRQIGRVATGEERKRRQERAKKVEEILLRAT
jgi:hypothetical protein